MNNEFKNSNMNMQAKKINIKPRCAMNVRKQYTSPTISMLGEVARMTAGAGGDKFDAFSNSDTLLHS